MIDSFKGWYKFLSNFYPCIVYYEGMKFPSNEHFYQAMKSMDRDEWERIIDLSSPSLAKKEGKLLKIREDWENVKEYFMLQGLLRKFSDTDLRLKLVDTYPLTLIEGNYWHDNYWGNCVCKKCTDIVGFNRLGYLLMKVRKYYMKENKLNEYS